MEIENILVDGIEVPQRVVRMNVFSNFNVALVIKPSLDPSTTEAEFITEILPVCIGHNNEYINEGSNWRETRTKERNRFFQSDEGTAGGKRSLYCGLSVAKFGGEVDQPTVVSSMGLWGLRWLLLALMTATKESSSRFQGHGIQEQVEINPGANAVIGFSTSSSLSHSASSLLPKAARSPSSFQCDIFNFAHLSLSYHRHKTERLASTLLGTHRGYSKANRLSTPSIFVAAVFRTDVFILAKGWSHTGSKIRRLFSATEL
uniref:Uncharacterized protein n=1 Tax=Timema monikensis TaxID=170555 RepID=A0A7R9HT09_9NEOP|nr:unnamed protein product [Timema monikensis]